MDDVSFELKRGETLGIIGPNGAGKTTVLKMLNGIFWPDKGRITIRGRVGALIEVGAGFHPMLSGRENIYVNGAILGMTKKEIDSKLSEIIEFADIGDFIDSPVRTYSSGMFVRLGFAVAVHCEPDILLIDEVLAVGDSNFITKSLNKVSSLIKERNMTVVFISHSNTMIRAVCKKAAYINGGVCKNYGDVAKVIEDYEVDSLQRLRHQFTEGYQRIRSDDKAEIVQISLLDSSGRERECFKIGEFLRVRVGISSKKTLENPGIEFVIFDKKGECILNQTSMSDGIVIPAITGIAYVNFSIEHLPFNTGIYSLSVKLLDGNLLTSIDYHTHARYFTMESGGRVGFNGLIYLDGKWDVSPQ